MSNTEPLCPTLAERLAFIQKGRATRRYHGLLMHDYQRVDAHSYGVAMLTLLIAQDAHEERRNRLLTAALVHDLAEWLTGDIPAPVKRFLSSDWRLEHSGYEHMLLEQMGLEGPTLDARDKRVLKIADAAEGCLHCIEERKMGNQTIGDRAFYAFWSYLEEEQQLNSHPDYKEIGEEDLVFYIKHAWEKANGGVW